MRGILKKSFAHLKLIPFMNWSDVAEVDEPSKPEFQFRPHPL